MGWVTFALSQARRVVHFYVIKINPAAIQKYIEEKVLRKAELAMGKSSVSRWILFIVSDSPHQVEEVEVRAGVWHRYIFEGARFRYPGLCGVGIRDRGSAQIPRLFTWKAQDDCGDVIEFLARSFVVEPLSG